MTARELAAALGRDNMSRVLGVGKTAVSNAVVRGGFPATWYFRMEKLCAERGIACPPSLFGMRGVLVASERTGSLSTDSEGTAC